MKFALRADWITVANSLTALANPGFSAFSAVTPFLSMVGGVLQRLTT